MFALYLLALFYGCTVLVSSFTQKITEEILGKLPRADNKNGPDIKITNEHLINPNDYEGDPFDSPLEMHDYEPQHSFESPVDMLSQNWIIFNDAVATSTFLRYIHP